MTDWLTRPNKLNSCRRGVVAVVLGSHCVCGHSGMREVLKLAGIVFLTAGTRERRLKRNPHVALRQVLCW